VVVPASIAGILGEDVEIVTVLIIYVSWFMAGEEGGMKVGKYEMVRMSVVVLVVDC